MKTKTAVMKLADIKESFYVRKGISDDRILHFAQLYEHKAEVPLIEVTEKSHTLVTGRHRKAAMILCGKEECEVSLIPEASLSDLIVYAFIENVGGSLPPTIADIQHTVHLLLDQKMSQRWIIEQLAKVGYPKSLVRRYIDNVQSDLAKAKKNRALAAITEGGKTVAEAAMEFDVDPEVLKETLRGKRKKANELGANVIKAGITSRFKSLAASNGRLLRNLVNRFEDGEVTLEVVNEVIGHVGRQLQNLVETNKDWQRRIEAAAKGDSGSSVSGSEFTSRKQSSERAAQRVLERMGIYAVEGGDHES